VKCPYPSCRREFDKLIVLVDDFDRMVRETYYACPHCKSRVDILVTGEDAFRFSPSEEDIPPSTSICPYYFGYLSSFSKDSRIPEECLTCTRIAKCMTRNL